jgi:hypothetical protein
MKDYTKNRKPGMLEPFFPNEILRHIIVSCFLVVIELVAIIVFPLPKLINKPEHITWFLLPVYYLKELMKNECLFIITLSVCALLFVLWPFATNFKSWNRSPNSHNDHT